jgi:uncharacterized protein
MIHGPGDNKTMTIVDMHAHVLPPEIIARREEYLRRDRWFGLLYTNPRARLVDAVTLLGEMEQAGVDLAVIFGFAFADPGLCRLCNDYILESSLQHPQQFIPFALVSPVTGREAEGELHRTLERGALGVGELMPDGQNFALTDFDLLDPLMGLTRAFRVPLMIHINEPVGHDYAGKCAQGPQQGYQLALRYPENEFILAHWGGGLPFYELMPEVRSVLRNVYYDTAASPFLYEDAIFRQVMDWAPNKVLWGSDYPLLKQGPFLKRVMKLGLEPSVLSKLLGDNALGLLGWPQRVQRG